MLKRPKPSRICVDSTRRGDKMTDQLSNLATNVAHFRQITEELSRIYEDKNKRYRDSFNKTLDKRGLVAALTRLDDKMNRLDYLIDVDNVSEMDDDAIMDTLRDLANYAIMTLMWLGKQK